MSTFLPYDVQAGLDAARIKALRKSSRLKIKTDQESFHVLSLHEEADETFKTLGIDVDGALMMANTICMNAL